jgi:hypothetical protein
LPYTRLLPGTVCNEGKEAREKQRDETSWINESKGNEEEIKSKGEPRIHLMRQEQTQSSCNEEDKQRLRALSYYVNSLAELDQPRQALFGLHDDAWVKAYSQALDHALSIRPG